MNNNYTWKLIFILWFYNNYALFLEFHVLSKQAGGMTKVRMFFLYLPLSSWNVVYELEAIDDEMVRKAAKKSSFFSGPTTKDPPPLLGLVVIRNGHKLKKNV